jgi:hypothetical protein
MYYRHGSKTFNDAEFGLRGFARTRVRGNRNEPVVDKWVISGFFEINPQLGSNASQLAWQKAITARWKYIAEAFVDGVDSGFLHQDKTPSAIYLDHSKSFSGVYVTQLPDLQPLNGADYANGHLGNFSVAADFVPPGGSTIGELVDYRESLTFQGNGGPLVVGTLMDRGPGYITQTAEQTFYQASQSGYAVGRTGWPTPNSPYWSSPILINPSAAVSYETPNVYGGSKIEYKTSWNYQFLSPEPLNKLPTIR